MTRFSSKPGVVILARQTLDLSSLNQDELNQDIFGLKVRLMGDALYSPWG